LECQNLAEPITRKVRDWRIPLNGDAMAKSLLLSCPVACENGKDAQWMKDEGVDASIPALPFDTSDAEEFCLSLFLPLSAIESPQGSMPPSSSPA
jgi:hypothetical protein